MAKTNVTSTNFAAKKLLGKTQVRPSFTEAEEAYPTNVSVPGAGVFAETIPRIPGTEMFTMYSASAGAPITVEKVYFDCVAIGDGYYDGNDSGKGGDEAQAAGNHAYYLKLPSNYQTTSSNPNRGTGSFVNDKRLYLSRGGLQLIPPFTTDAGLPGSGGGSNKYYVELFTGDPTNEDNKISETSPMDWQFDYYSGIIFIQDYDASLIPVTASAYLYVGKYLDEKITDISADATMVVKDEGSNITTAASSFNFVGASVVASNNGNDVTVTLTDTVYSRTPVTSTTTSSVSDNFLGVSASAAIDIRLPAASGFSNGQYFTIKDEAGNSNTNNITVKTTGGDTIDGQASIILESPYGAVNLYTNGSDKFFIY